MATVTLAGGGTFLSGTGQPVTMKASAIAKKAASFINGQNQPPIIELCFDGLVSCVHDANMKSYMRFLVEEDATTTLVADQPNYTVPTNLDWPLEFRLEKSDKVRALTQIPETQEPYDVVSGTPINWYHQNIWLDRTVWLSPTPNSSIAADYTLTAIYYKRITKPTMNSHVQAPVEFEDVMCWYAAWYALMQKSGEPWRVAMCRREYEGKFDAFKAMQKRDDGSVIAWRVPTRFRPRG